MICVTGPGCACKQGPGCRCSCLLQGQLAKMLHYQRCRCVRVAMTRIRGGQGVSAIVMSGSTLDAAPFLSRRCLQLASL